MVNNEEQPNQRPCACPRLGYEPRCPAHGFDENAAPSDAHSERTGLPEYLDDLRAALDEQEGRANYWERKAKTYRRQMVEERAKVARVEAVMRCAATHCHCGGDRASVQTRELRAALDAE